MHILHIGKYFPPVSGGMERYLDDLTAAQKQHGLDITILAHQTRGKTTHSTLPDGRNLIRTGGLGTLLYTPIAPGFRRRVRNILRKSKPDVIHVHLPNPSAFWLLTLPEARQIPWVMHWHSDVGDMLSHPIARQLYKLYAKPERALLRQARRVIPTSEAYASASSTLAPFAHQCHAIPLGIDPERLKNSEPVQDHLGDNADKVLFVGRHAHYKDIPTLLAIAKSMPDVDFWIVGSGEESALIRRAAKTQKNIHPLGSLPDAQVNWLMEQAHVMVLTSHQRSEAFGVVLLEAMAKGLPVVASNIPGSGVPWVVHMGEHGVVAECGDVDSFKTSIERLLSDENARAVLAEKGRQNFIRLFTIDASMPAFDRVYRQVINLG